MVVSKEQQAEDKMLNELAAIVKKLTTGMETLNGVQTQAVATMIKEIAQRNGVSLTTKRHTLDVKRETELGHKALDVKERLKVADTYLVRLRHRLNIQMEREHGQQVRRNINLRQNMDNFHEALGKTKQAIMGGAGFQSAIGTTVKKLAGMTRSYQEHEIAQKELATSTVEAQTAFDNLQMMMGDTVDEITKQEGELKTAELKLSGHEEQVKDTGKAAQGTQGMFKPLFEKLGKLGDFLGKKAIPIGIGVGVAGIFMSIIVKAFSASPLFAAMMKMMKFMVTLILMPIGTFFGALLRPILILLLRKLIIPMFSTWMPIMMKAGDQLGKWLTSWSWKSFIAAIDSLNPFTTTETEEEKAAKIEAERKESERIAKEGTEGTTTPDGKYQVTEQSDLDFIQFTKDLEKLWERLKNPAGTGEEKIFNAEPIQPGGILFNDDANASTGDDEPVKVEWDMSGENSVFNGKTPNDETEAERQVREDKEALDRKNLMKSDQEINDIKMQEAKDQIALEEAAWHKENARIMERDRASNTMNDLMDTYRNTGGIIAEALPSPQQWNTMNPKSGLASKIKNAGITGSGNTSSGYTMGSSAKGSSILDAYWAERGITPAANGFDGMVNKPTMFLAGEAGSEHVKVTPNGQSSGSGGITVNIQNMNGSDNDLRKLKKTILEVIQESSANRGRI